MALIGNLVSGWCNIDLNNPLIYQKLNSKTNHNNTSPKKVSLVLGRSIGTHCEKLLSINRYILVGGKIKKKDK
jgi:hypothetical protein